MTSKEEFKQLNTDPEVGSLVLWFLLPGLLQGAAIHVITEVWDTAQFELNAVVLLWLVAIGPVAHHLVTTRAHRLSSYIVSLAVALLCALLFRDLAHRFLVDDALTTSYDGDGNFPFQTSIICSMILVTHLLPFYRTVVQRRAPWNHYRSLFEFSWNQFIALIVGGLFALLMLGVLMLAVGLFNILGIDLDEIVMRKDVLLIISGGAFGLGIGITRTKDTIVHGMRQLLISLLRSLLVVLVIITLGFVVVAIGKGLNQIGTGWSVTYLLLTAIGFCVVLCSAAVGDTLDPVKPLLKQLCRLQSAILLLMGLLAVWAVLQRIDQYGLTHSRIIAGLATAVAILYGLGYTLAAVTKHQVHVVQQTNVAVAIVSMGIAVIIQTPVFDTVKIATNSQLDAFHSGFISSEEIDLAYLKHDAGQAGREALQHIKDSEAAEFEPLAGRLKRLDQEDAYTYRQEEHNQIAKTKMEEKLALARNTITHVAKSQNDKQSHELLVKMLLEFTSYEGTVVNKLCFTDKKPCYFIQMTFPDGAEGFLLALRQSDDTLHVGWWTPEYMSSELSYFNFDVVESNKHTIQASKKEIDSLTESLDAGQIPLVDHNVKALAVGERRIVVPFSESLW